MDEGVLLIFNEVKMKNLVLCGDVDTMMMSKLMNYLGDFNFDKHKELNINLCTYGGYTDVAFGIYDVLKEIQREYGIKVYVICNGACYSSGVIIACGATEILTTKNSNFLIHYGEETNTNGDELKFNKRLTNKMKEVIREKTGASKRRVHGWISKETYFDAEEAKKVNLVDYIFGDNNE